MLDGGLIWCTGERSGAQVKDGEIEELTREIQMYYGIKRHIEELTKENQVMLNLLKQGIHFLATS